MLDFSSDSAFFAEEDPTGGTGGVTLGPSRVEGRNGGSFRESFRKSCSCIIYFPKCTSSRSRSWRGQQRGNGRFYLHTFSGTWLLPSQQAFALSTVRRFQMGTSNKKQRDEAAGLVLCSPPREMANLEPGVICKTAIVWDVPRKSLFM